MKFHALRGKFTRLYSQGREICPQVRKCENENAKADETQENCGQVHKVQTIQI